MDIRKKYFDLTGDYDGAYGVAESGQEQFKYSDDSIMRALNALGGSDDYAERQFMAEQMTNYGPRAGSAIGQMYGMTPSAGQEYFEKSLADFKSARASDDPDKYRQMMEAGGGLLNSIVMPVPTRQYGAMRGLFDALFGDK